MIATQVHEHALAPLAALLFEHGIALLVRLRICIRSTAPGGLFHACHTFRVQTARTYGLIGTSTAVIPEHRILHAKSDDSREDLRIGTPFPSLRAFVDSIDLQLLDANGPEFGHVPFLVLLVKAMDAWRSKQTEPPRISLEVVRTTLLGMS